MAFKETEIAGFIDQVKEQGKYYTNDPNFNTFVQDTIDFLTGQNTTLIYKPTYYFGYAFVPLLNLLPKDISKWEKKHDLLLDLTKILWNNLGYNLWYVIEDATRDNPKQNTIEFYWKKLLNMGFSEADLLKEFVYRFYYYFKNQQKKVTSAGLFVLEKLRTNEKDTLKAFYDYSYSINFLVELLLLEDKELAEKYASKFLKHTSYEYNGIMEQYLIYNAEKYEEAAKKVIDSEQDPKRKIDGYNLLNKYFKDKYKGKSVELWYEYLDWYIRETINPQRSYFYEYSQYIYDKKGNYQTSIPLSAFYLDKLLETDRKNAIAYFDKFIESTNRYNEGIVDALDKHLKQDAVPYFFKFLRADGKKNNRSFFKKTFDSIGKYDFAAYENELWEIAKSKNKGVREMACITLAKLKDKAIPNAEKMLFEGKNADTRQAGALILSLIGTEKTKKILLKALNDEKSDDARDLMLVNLADKLYKKADEKVVAEMVNYAKERGKLDKPVEKWIDESKLADLYFVSGKKLDNDTKRFLLYRMSRAKEMKSDIEAKVVLNLIDRAKSGEFARELFRLYLGNGADAKQKYCLALAGLLGDDEVVQTLRSTVQRWTENTLKWSQDDKGNWQQTGESARLKMAEYAVGALALIGSNKALRAVEFFSRKYRSKNKNIGEAARVALKNAAEELGISPYELADSIIPDFGFEGLFKNFEVNGNEYRAFIDNNFKLAYFDENNKKLKAPPKGTPKELQEEFKEVAKEVRDIVRSQSDRLEQYMVIGRRWSKENWEKFFLNNPIMFVYAIKLVWGEFDKNGKLLQTFYCSEDTTLMNIEDDEISLEEDSFVGMLHPLHISKQEAQDWQNKLYEMGIETIFEQMNRPIFDLEENLQNTLISDRFNNRKVDARSAVGYFEKLGWKRGSVVDAGMVSAYCKSFEDAGIDALIETEGIFMGYYDYDDCHLGRLYFVKTGSVQFGSYTYDEPRDEKDTRLIAFKDVPVIIYSEVIGDLEKIAPKQEEQEQKQ